MAVSGSGGGLDRWQLGGVAAHSHRPKRAVAAAVVIDDVRYKTLQQPQRSHRSFLKVLGLPIGMLSAPRVNE